MRFMSMVAAMSIAAVANGAYDIGSDMEEESFWKSDPVLFVKKHADAGFQFTSDQRDGADSRTDGGVEYHGIPVFESRVSFAEGGGIARVELLLFNNGGTEAVREYTDETGKKFRRRERVEKTVTREEFFAMLDNVRGKLTAAGAKPPAPVAERVKDKATVQKNQTWPKTDVPTQATLLWNYRQNGRKTDTFEPGFVRVAVNGPARLAGTKKQSSSAKGAAKGAAKITDNIVKDPRGDVFIDNVPMVDQGQKGYCSAATAERVLRYFGLDVDEHEIAQAAGTTAEGGTSTKGMKDSVEAVGKKFKLATVVCYGDFDKGVEARIAGIVDEVRVYNKAAKKLKKPAIEDSVYIEHRGNVTYYNPAAVDKAMDPEVLKEMKVNGGQKSKYKKFLSDIHQQVDKGIPLFWGVTLGTYPEPGIPQTAGGHMRLIIGYNDKKKEILYTDSWGAGHELKRMPADWAWAISHCLMYMKPLSR